MYRSFQQDPNSIEESWRDFFRGFDFAQQSTNGHAPAPAGDIDWIHVQKELQVLSLIKAYRTRGHMEANVDPLDEFEEKPATLDIEDFNLTEADLNTEFKAGEEMDLQNATLRQIIDQLRHIYCGNIGFEYHHIADRDKRRWLRERIESSRPEVAYGISIDKKRRILEKLNGAVGFENFLGKKYLAQKRFSLEGGENTIVAIDSIINAASDERTEEIVIGMAHRGRLNVLANIMGKTYEMIFREFEGVALPDLSFGDGDVKYHLGYSSLVTTPAGKKVHLKLVPNPSHLEAVDPVVEGFTRAKSDILYENDYDRILPILIHGDAAVAGQGVVYETVQMSGLDGYKTGGTIHFVINNQIGFTTDYEDARSSYYATGAAGVIEAPVFHVNGDDPEAVVFACELAVAYRQEFNSDVFIDMFCYRKHGHNEGDDPQYTQPRMYDWIKNHPDPRQIYTDVLDKRGDLDRELAEEMQQKFWNDLQARLDEVRQKSLPYTYQEPEKAWRKLKKLDELSPADFQKSPVTGIPEDQVERILDHLMTFPDGFKPLSKVKRLMKNMKKMRDADQLDWAFGELLAYASILLDGKDVRMSGQDIKRGTFSHRHAVVRDAETYKTHTRLHGLSPDQGQFHIYNSFLSEFAVLGFEYGYSLATPDALVLWEAQFGDFANGAQTIFDQFISAGESKWRRMSGLVCLLPHGYEGQGPEHSSGRIERFLQLCAGYNMTIANCTVPANFFHLLRRQLARPFRKPLIHFSPKSGLRHPMAVSSVKDFAKGTRFQEIIDDPTVPAKGNKKIKRVLLCSGKVYFDLAAYKEENKRDDVAIVRLEQLYPIPHDQLRDLAKRYAQAEFLWVQEEPANMGAWFFINAVFDLQDLEVEHTIRYVGRTASASPATGFKKRHDEEQTELVEKAFA